MVFEKRLVSTRSSTDYNVQWLATVKIHFYVPPPPLSTHYPHLPQLSLSLSFQCVFVVQVFMLIFFYVFDFISWPLKLFPFGDNGKLVKWNFIFHSSSSSFLAFYFFFTPFFSVELKLKHNYVIYLCPCSEISKLKFIAIVIIIAW